MYSFLFFWLESWEKCFCFPSLWFHSGLASMICIFQAIDSRALDFWIIGWKKIQDHFNQKPQALITGNQIEFPLICNKTCLLDWILEGSIAEASSEMLLTWDSKCAVACTGWNRINSNWWQTCIEGLIQEPRRAEL